MMNNKKAFQIYIIINLLSYIFLGFLISVVYVPRLLNSDWSFLNLIIPNFGFTILYILAGIMLIFIFIQFIVFLIRPAYIETIISEKELIIRTFKPNKGIGRSIFRMLRYRKYMKEIKLNKQEYNDYKLKIDTWGFRKILILQKINKSGIFETSEINISLLGQKKYTNLILAIDRLQGKINLN